MQRSTVKWFDAKKGYGFIDHPEGGDDIFIHYSQIVSEKDFKTLRTGQEVAFTMNDGPKGLHALNVKTFEEHGDAALQEGDASESSEVATSVATEQAPSTNGTSHSGDGTPSEPEPATVEEYEDEWDEDWTDEHGNPPDPMAGPTF